MKPLFQSEEFNQAKPTTKLKCQCYQCEAVFLSEKKYIQSEMKLKRGRVRYCSPKCLSNAQANSHEVFCTMCNMNIKKKHSQFKRHKNHFCSRSCAATYNNTHKTHGTRRSKLEVWLEQKLPVLYPSLEFHFNRKDAINAELDIYIPSLKLAFELNGLFHYEPIFGADKLAQIQNNDQRRHQSCMDNGIELCLIDVSSFNYFKIDGAKKYLSDITNIINSK